MTPVHLYAEFEALPGAEERLAHLVRDFSSEVRSEPGNMAFEACTKKADPAAFFVYEIYRDDDAFQVHLGSDAGKSFNAALGTLVKGGGSRLTHILPL